MATRKGKKGAAKKAATKVVKKAAKKVVTKSPGKSAKRAPATGTLAAETDFVATTIDIRTRVVAIIANVTGQPVAKVDGLCLSDLAKPCDLVLRGRTASELNDEWPKMTPPFKVQQVACTDTADSLSYQVTIRTA